MNIENFKKRIEELIESKRKHSTMIHVIDGAIQDCEYWIDHINKENKNKNENGEK